MPGLDLPGLDAVRIAQGYGVTALAARTADEVRSALRDALRRDGPTLIEVPVTPEPGKLLG